MSPDPERLLAAASAIAGGAFYGLFSISALYLSGQPVTRGDLNRALINLACAVAGGFLAAYFLFPALAALIPWPSLRDAQGLGFMIGAVGWVVTPSAYKLAKALAEKKAAEKAQ